MIDAWATAVSTWNDNGTWLRAGRGRSRRSPMNSACRRVRCRSGSVTSSSCRSHATAATPPQAAPVPRPQARRDRAMSTGGPGDRRRRCRERPDHVLPGVVRRRGQQDRRSRSLANTDRVLMGFFLMARTTFPIDESRLRMKIHLHDDLDLDGRTSSGVVSRSSDRSVHEAVSPEFGPKATLQASM